MRDKYIVYNNSPRDRKPVCWVNEDSEIRAYYSEKYGRNIVIVTTTSGTAACYTGKDLTLKMAEAIASNLEIFIRSDYRRFEMPPIITVKYMSRINEIPAKAEDTFPAVYEGEGDPNNPANLF